MLPGCAGWPGWVGRRWPALPPPSSSSCSGVGGPAAGGSCRATGSGHAAAAAAAAAPRPRPRHGVRAVAAVGEGGRGPPGPPVPPVPVCRDAPAAPVADLGAGRPAPSTGRLRVPIEEHVICTSRRRGPGKTGALAEIIARYPGPVVVTTTRGDLYALTAAARAARGPVHVCNPQRLAGVPSTMRWDLLGGCADPATAIRRAVPLSAVAAFKGEGEDFWAAAIELWLQTLLHVAALRRATMDLVHYWALSRPRGVPACAARRGRGSRAVGHADPRPDDVQRRPRPPTPSGT